MNYNELNARLDFLVDRMEKDKLELETLIDEKIKRERNEARARAQREIGQPLKPIIGMSYDEQHEYLSLLAEIHGIKHAIYSVGDNLDVVAHEGKCTLTHEGWHDEEYSEIAESPTWLDVWKFADRAIPKVDDGHHVFLEGIYKNKFDNILGISMGS